jgi:hypothetical protein
MKKSVRIRKAGPGETPGYYNKTAKFLDKALPKAKMGMQVGNGIQDKLQVIMLDTYSTLRDGGDPQEVFRKLLMEYGMPQEMAYKVMQTVMQKLAQDGYADPASLQQDQEDDWDAAQQPQQGEAEQAVVPNQNPGTPDEDEQLALSEAEGDTGYDAMDYYNNRDTEQQEEQGAFSRYGGPFRKKLRRAQEGMQQPSEEEMMMMQQQQQQQPPQQGQEQGGDQMQQIMQQVGQALQQGAKPEEIIVQLLQGQIPPEAIVQIFVEFGMEQEQVVGLIQAVMSQLQGGQEQQMQQEPQMSQEEMMKHGGMRRLKRAQEGMQQPSEEEMAMMQAQQQQQQPQQQEGGQDQMQQLMQQISQALEQGGKPEELIPELLQNSIPPEVIMQIFVQLGMPEEQVKSIIQSVMQQMQGGQESQEMMRYGGSYNYGGEYDNYFDEEQTPEDTVIDQYSNPGQLSTEQKAPMSIEAMLQSFNLPNNKLETPDLNAYLQGMYNYQNVGTEGIPNDLLPRSKHGGAHISLPLARRGKEKKASKKRNPEPTSETRVEPTITIEPQETTVAPSILQNLQNAYYQKNAVAPQRGTFGTAAQVLGTGLNYLRPRNWADSSKAFGLIGGRSEVEPSTTATKTYEDIYKMLRDPDYKPETLIDNGDKTYSSGLAFNMGPQLYETLIESANNPRIREQLQKSGQVQLELPTSKVPELNFLSLHNENNNTRLRLSLDNDGALKASLVTFIDTPLKGTKSKNVVIKDEFFIDPKTKTIIDPKTGMPLEMIQKSYYKGNELNWYNQSGTLPFTKKYGSGFDFTGYPEVVSSEPLRKEPRSRWRAAWNTIGKPLFASPFVLPFTYPGFAAKNKFFPNADKVTVDYFGRSRELGPQAPGGMTFGDQPFGAQYADYSLQANRNYLTGRNFLLGAGLLGAGIGGATLYYNRDTDDFEVGAEQQDYKVPVNQKNIGFGYSFDLNGFSRKRPDKDYKENNYGVDSMYINNGDTMHDKGWGELAPGYKHGGAHKKKFLKRMSQMFEPGGETQDPSLGKGNRMDDNDQVAKKKNNFVNILKKQSNKAVNEEVYDLVQKSDDPKLIDIFMGNGQSNQETQQPMSNRQMAAGGDPCPNDQYWNGKECVPYAQGVPSKEELFNNPEMLDYLNKLNKKRNVQKYKYQRKNQLNDFIKENYKGQMKQHDDGTPYPDMDSPEWDEFIRTKEWREQREKLPDPENQNGPFNFPEGYEQKEFYPKDGDWDENSKKYFNEFFNSKPDDYLEKQKTLEEYLKNNPELQQELYDLDNQKQYQKGYERENEIYKSIPEDDPSRNYEWKEGELQKERYDDWCPCQKTEEIIVQGRPVQQTICVPCEQAQEGGYVNMDTDNPLTRFVYGGDEPDYYEQDNLPEARNGGVKHTPPVMKYDEWFKDYTSEDNWPGAYAENEPWDNKLSEDPDEANAYQEWMQNFNDPLLESEGKRFDAYQNYLNFRNEDEEDGGGYLLDKTKRDPIVGETYDTWYTSDGSTPGFVPDNRVWDGTKWSNGTGNKNTHNCPPGSLWVEKYQQCVPIMQIKLNPRIVSGDPGLHNIFLPWNPIFKTRGYKTKYGDRLTLKDLQKYAGKDLGDPYATLSYRKNMLSPKRQLDIWNPDGKLSEADMKALMDYGVGSGWKSKGNKSKGNKSKGSSNNYNKSNKSKEEKLSKTELIDRELKKDEWNKENWDDRIANNKSNLRNARRNFAFENPEFRRFSDKVVFKTGLPGNYYEKTERVKEKKDKLKGK